MNRENTGMHDKHSKPIYVGDTVKKRWGYEWVTKTADYGYHIIKKRIEGNSIHYTLGDTYNNWRGCDVEVVGNSHNT